LTWKATISKTLESRIIKLLGPVFGDSMRVAVNAVVDINKRVSEQTTYTPAIDGDGVIARQENSRETSGGTGAAAAFPARPKTAASRSITQAAPRPTAGAQARPPAPITL
jgi:flagellar biosynthesis/type III secretory pathway M-ring protein FliF/YscJ